MKNVDFAVAQRIGCVSVDNARELSHITHAAIALQNADARAVCRIHLLRDFATAHKIMRFFGTYAQLLLHVGTKCCHSLFHLCGRHIAIEDFDFEQATFVKSLGELRQNGVFVLTPHADGAQ